MRRKAAGTIRVDGARPRRPLRLGARPRPQRAARAGRRRPGGRRPATTPTGPHRLTAVPTVLRSGDAFNVVPGARRAVLRPARRRRSTRSRPCSRRSPPSVDGVALERGADPPLAGHALRGGRPRRVLERATAALGRPVAAVPRGGASDASHFAAAIPVTVDGLGPRGGAAHNPERVRPRGVAGEPRAEVALAVRAGRAQPASTRASDSSSRGRSSTSSSPWRPRDADRGDAALLEVHAAAGEVVDDLRERRVVADDEHARVAVVGVQQLERVVAVEAVGERRRSILGLDVERRGRRAARCRARGPSGSCSRRRTRRRAAASAVAGRDRLALAAGGQLALVVGLGVVRDGLAVAQKPELRRHRARSV